MKKSIVLALAVLCAAVALSGSFLRPFTAAFAAETAAAGTGTAQTAEETPQAAENADPQPEGFSEKIAYKFMGLFKEGTGGEIIAFLASMLPIVECRGAMFIAKIFDHQIPGSFPFWKAFLICYIGNMVPIPFILLLIKKIFAFMKKHHILTGFIEKLEGKTAKNRDKVLRYEQWGLLAFVAVPLPGTGGWTGSLFAALLDIDFKKSLPIIALGVFVADVIMTFIVYGGSAILGI